MDFSTVGIIGALGIAGSDLLSLLEAKLSNDIDLRLFDVSNDGDALGSFRGEELEIEEFTEDCLRELDLAVFVDQSLAVPAEHLSLINELGLRVIDCTGSLVGTDHENLVLGTLPDGIPAELPLIVSVPSPGATQLSTSLSVISDFADIERVLVTGWEPVSTAGQLAMDELWEQGLAVYNQQDLTSSAFEHQIVFNCIPQVGLMDETGETSEESRLVDQCRRLLGEPGLNMVVTLIRAPIFYGVNQNVSVFFNSDIDLEQLKKAFSAHESIEFYGSVGYYPMPINVVTTNGVHIGRLRQRNPREIHFWCVSDNVYTGLGMNIIPLIHNMLQS